MNSLISTHKALVEQRVSPIRRGLMDKIDRNKRLIAIKGSRGVGKTCFLLDYCKEFHREDRHCLYVNINNLFIVSEGLYHCVEYFYKLGGKVLLLDQVHKYPGWDKEILDCYNAFPDLQIIFTASSIVRVKSNSYLKGIVEMYNLNGLSFREFLQLNTGHTFPVYTFDEIAVRHEEIVEDILSRVRPLAYFRKYLQHGYYPAADGAKPYLDYLLKNINLTLEFDIPYINQIELNYLTKLKKLLYIAAKETGRNVNISKLSAEIGVSRATVLNYLTYMKNARLLTLIFDAEIDDDGGKKPKKLYLHNPNLLNAVCLADIDTDALCKSFLLSQLCSGNKISYTHKADFQVDDKHKVMVCEEGRSGKINSSIIAMEDMIERGKGNVIPLWLAGFTY